MFRSISARAKRKPSSKATQKRHFSRNVHTIDARVPLVPVDDHSVLYRGIRQNVFDVNTTLPLFRDTCIFAGITPCFTAFDPENTVITNYIAATHKELPIFTSLSFVKGSSKVFAERGPLLTVNLTNLPDLMLVDTEKAYYNENREFYKLKQEYELTVFAILYASIKSFDFQGKTISNPFCLPILPSDQENCRLFQELYDVFCKMQHVEFMEPSVNYVLQRDELKHQYFKKLFVLYDKVLGRDNPFNMSLREFQSKYPDYSEWLLHHSNKQNADNNSRVVNLEEAMNHSVFDFLADGRNKKDYINDFCIGEHRKHRERNAKKYLADDPIIKSAFKI